MSNTRGSRSGLIPVGKCSALVGNADLNLRFDRGSQFLVRLTRPRPQLPLPDEQAHAEPCQSANVRRVLVVDDSVDSAQSTAMVLKLAGHELWVAQEDTGALAAAAQFRPDVVVMDIGLPDMSGYDVARHVRGRRETARAVMALTGYGQPKEVFRIKSAVFDYHLVKPSSPELHAAWWAARSRHSAVNSGRRKI